MSNNDICCVCHKTLHPHTMGEKDGYGFIACKVCGSIAVTPSITQDNLDNFFGEVQPVATHMPNPTLETSHMRRQLKKLLKEAQIHHPKKTKILDTSCRHGYTIKAAKDLGFVDVKGIDRHDFFIKFAKNNYGQDLFEHSSLQDYVTQEDMQADLVISTMSFCEEIDPDAYASALANSIKPGGIIYIEEPDGNSFWLPRRFTTWPFVEPPLNFLYPSFKGMKVLLRRHGLKVKRKFFSFGPFMRLIVTK